METKHETMDLSIIIPVYKVEKYISRCIESVILQEIKDFEVECIIVDDCSPDNSVKIAHDLTDNYQGPIKFRYYRHETNKAPVRDKIRTMRVDWCPQYNTPE